MKTLAPTSDHHAFFTQHRTPEGGLLLPLQQLSNTDRQCCPRADESGGIIGEGIARPDGPHPNAKRTEAGLAFLGTGSEPPAHQ